ncbi:translation initiation factor IF-2 [Blattabacterium cuenoti]|uniref:translation initiation factor IF-2 n=1 Tax=Blattabacterium cuenoti TaxID=1653831 RepID=UPI00163CFBD8|nr:translation initiation factor IF-2 [Blattabacterium cuenoti]
MTHKIRLKTVLTKLNISLQRVLDFLKKKGIKIENNPNSKIEDKIYQILVKKFQSQKTIRDNYEKIFLKKKLETKKIQKELSKSQPKIIRAKINHFIKFKKLGKIDINQYDKEKQERTKDISKLEIHTNNSRIIEKKHKKKPEHIDTVYQKLDGVMLTGDRIDLSQFEKKKTKVKIKTKRKRIKKEILIDDIKKSKQLNNNKKHYSYKFDKHRIKNNKIKFEITDKVVNKQIKETLEKLSSRNIKSKSSKIKKEKKLQKKEKNNLLKDNNNTEKSIKLAEFTTVNELSSMMKVNPADIIVACMSLGIMVTMNQRLDAEIITLVADEFGYNVEFVGIDLEESIQQQEDIIDNTTEQDLITRPPIITVMGHVDHGKTSLLDYIRQTNVIAGEYGGITQHISAYNVKYKNNYSITFLDTPGHEAFTAMRARGAQITDIAIIMIASDDQVMLQTKEAISHAQAANVPIIFAFNKIDKSESNTNKIREQLANINLLVEEWGGKYPSQEISAKLGTGIDQLLEKVLLIAELLELKANPKKMATGTIIEASLDKGRGYVTTILVQNGTLKIGDYVLAGFHHGKVKNILDERGKSISSAVPSQPVTILGLNGTPSSGDKFKVFLDEKFAKQLATRREQLQREQNIRSQKHLTLDDIGRRIALGNFKELKILLKGDVDGSVEAISDSLEKLSTKNIMINIIHKGVGSITESDILLASASDAIIIGFNVRPTHGINHIIKKENIEIRIYSIIYDVINDFQEAIKGMLSTEIKEKILGNAEVRDMFNIPKLGIIAGCIVTEGKLIRTSTIRLIRNGIVIYTGELISLKRFKKDVKEVSKGYECGVIIKDYNDIQNGDIIEVYQKYSK